MFTGSGVVQAPCRQAFAPGGTPGEAAHETRPPDPRGSYTIGSERTETPASYRWPASVIRTTCTPDGGSAMSKATAPDERRSVTFWPVTRSVAA